MTNPYRGQPAGVPARYAVTAMCFTITAWAAAAVILILA